MATYSDKFFAMDPGNPPAGGTALTAEMLSLTDGDNNNYLTDPAWHQHASQFDRINGEQITNVWDGDTITVIDNATGATRTISGVTFYTASGGRYFTPSDGSNLHDSTFVSSTFVTHSTGMAIGDLGTPCFTTGTLILTARGDRAVETLVPGDLVMTRDHGLQPLRWIGSKTVSGIGPLAPVHLRKGALGNRRDLLVSPQHRMMVDGWRQELLFGQAEVLVSARHLVNGTTITHSPRREVTYVHLLFDRHEVIEAEGIPTESLHPGDYLLSCDAALRGELLSIFPGLADAPAAKRRATARCVLKPHEAQLLSFAA